MIRNRHKVGSYLMMDDESGYVHYREDMRQIWDGTWRHKNTFETRQPQEFVYARNDPKPLRNIRPEPLCATVDNGPAAEIGSTTVDTPTSPAGHIFGNRGIGQMLIEGTNPNTVFIIT
jgi:hypothetical protein